MQKFTALGNRSWQNGAFCAYVSSMEKDEKKNKKNRRKHDVMQLCSAASSLMLPFTFRLPLGLVNALAPGNVACTQSLDL